MSMLSLTSLPRGGPVTDRSASISTTVAPEPAVQSRLLDNYIGGVWVPPRSGERLDVTDPASGEVLARVGMSARADVEDAVTAAREAFATWRAVPVVRRAQLLFRLREQLSATARSSLGRYSPQVVAGELQSLYDTVVTGNERRG